MSAGAEPQPERRPRLNPFAFPSDTTFRFVLLVLAVLGATLYVWQWIYAAVVVDTQRFADQAAACRALGPPDNATLDQYLALDGSMSECVRDSNRPMAWWMLGGAGFVVALAVALTLARPWWHARRRRLVTLAPEDAPAVHAEVQRLADEAGLSEQPALVWNPLDSSAGGLAYGHTGRYTVALTGGLVVRQATDPEAFRAVVRHELAHIRNRDVDLTYATVSLWHAFLVGAVAPFVLTLLDEGSDTVVRVTWRLLALAALVYLTRNAVLRSREVYADVRASVGADAGAAIRRVLAALPVPRGPAWRRWLRVHPSPADRLAMVDDTEPLFRIGLLTAFGAGVAATTSYESVVEVVSTFVTDPLDMRFIAALAFAPAVVGVVGVGVWRSTFASLAAGRRPAPTWPLGLALAGGFLVGPELALEGTVATGDDALLTSVLHGEGWLWLIGLVGALTLLLAWIGACATTWQKALGGRRWRAVTWVVLLASAGVLTVVMGVFYVTRDLRPVLAVTKAVASVEHATISQLVWALPEPVYHLVTNGLVVWTALRPELLPVLLVLVLLPFAAALVHRRRDSSGGAWAFLDPGGRLAVPQLVLRPLRPIVVGLLGGAVAIVGLAVLRLGIHAGISETTRPQVAFLFAFLAWQLALAFAVQAATAAVAVAASIHDSRVLDGLLAALVAGSVAWFGIIAGPSAGGCLDPLSVNPGPCSWSVEGSFAWDLYRRVVEQGAVAALAAALLTTGVLALWRRLRPADELQPAGVPG